MNKNCTCLVVWISIIVLITHIMNEKRVLGLDELFTKMKTYEHQIQRMILQNLQLIQANYTRTSQLQSHSFKGNSYPSPKTFPEPNNTSLGSNTYSKPKTTHFSQIQCQIYKRFGHNSSQFYFYILNLGIVDKDPTHLGLNLLILVKIIQNICHRCKINQQKTCNSTKALTSFPKDRPNQIQDVQSQAFLSPLANLVLIDIHWHIDIGATHYHF